MKNKIMGMISKAEFAMQVNNARTVKVIVKKGRKIVREFELLQEKHLYKTSYSCQGGHHS